MSEFKEVAHRTVVELFDLAKEQQAEIKQLKTQLNNMEQCYIQIKKINDEQSAIIHSHVAARIELQNRVDGALFEMRQLSLMLSKDIDGYEDPAQICQSEGVDMGVKILEKALRGEHE